MERLWFPDKDRYNGNSILIDTLFKHNYLNKEQYDLLLKYLENDLTHNIGIELLKSKMIEFNINRWMLIRQLKVGLKWYLTKIENDAIVKNNNIINKKEFTHLKNGAIKFIEKNYHVKYGSYSGEKFKNKY